MVVRIVYTSGIVDHQCLYLLFISRGGEKEGEMLLLKKEIYHCQYLSVNQEYKNKLKSTYSLFQKYTVMYTGMLLF